MRAKRAPTLWEIPPVAMVLITKKSEKILAQFCNVFQNKKSENFQDLISTFYLLHSAMVLITKNQKNYLLNSAMFFRTKNQKIATPYFYLLATEFCNRFNNKKSEKFFIPNLQSSYWILQCFSEQKIRKIPRPYFYLQPTEFCNGFNNKKSENSLSLS